LIIANQKTDLYSKTKSSEKSYITINTGIGGVGFATCIDTKSDNSWIELCISKKDANENSKIFNDYFNKKTEIENKFGEHLRWVDENGIKRCKIMSETLPLTANINEWDKLHNELVRKMVKLTDALKGYSIY
jgi:hypothetical protein